MKCLASTSAALAVAFAAAPAVAQEADVAVSGDGYKLSEGTVLHSSAGLRGGYVSNVFFEQEETDPVASGILRVLGQLSVASRSGKRLGDEGAPPKLSFDTGLGFEYHEYLSGNGDARAQRDLDLNAHGNLVAFPEGTISLIVRDQFTRATRPTNFESSQNLDRDVNRFTAGIDWNPGGRAFQLGLRYRNRIDIFEDDTAPYPNRMHNTGHLEASWQILPVTRIFFDGSAGYYSTIGDQDPGDIPKRNAVPLSAVLGVGTALTERTTLKAHAGYKATLYDEGEDFTGVVGGANLGYRYSPLGRVTLGYAREVEDSINANFYADHRLHAGINQQIEKALLHASGQVRFRDYGGIPMAVSGGQDREDLIVRTGLGVQYLFRDSIAASLDYSVTLDETDYRQPGNMDDPSYVRHVVMAGAQAAF